MTPTRATKQQVVETALSECIKHRNSPVYRHAWTEREIVNHVRLGKYVTLGPLRKLIHAALLNKCLRITIGIPPGSPRGEEEDSKNPIYFYEGPDIMKLAPLLTTRKTLLDCTATLAYDGGGLSVETETEAIHAFFVIGFCGEKNPSLTLHF